MVGTLCSELAEGKELNAACQSWNKRVDPANYHKATAPITKRQIAEAQKFVEENGFEDSFNRKLVSGVDLNPISISLGNKSNSFVKEIPS